MDQPVDTKAELLTQHFEICRMLMNSVFDEEVSNYTEKRYRKRPHDGGYYRHGFNSGSVHLGSRQIKLDVPRVYDQESKICV